MPYTDTKRPAHADSIECEAITVGPDTDASTALTSLVTALSAAGDALDDVSGIDCEGFATLGDIDGFASSLAAAALGATVTDAVVCSYTGGLECTINIAFGALSVNCVR